MIHAESREAAGSRTITAQLNREGESIGRYKVRSLMKELNTINKQPFKKPQYKISGNPSKIVDNVLNRQFNVEAPNQVWCSDVTYVRHRDGWLYLSLVIDLFSRQIIGWSCSESPDTLFTKKSLDFAYKARGRPESVFFHTDRGCYYTSVFFQESLKSYNFKSSMSRRGATCWDNVIIERTFRTFKSEWMPKATYESYQVAEHDFFQFIKYGNHLCYHSYNDYVPPAEAEKLYLAAQMNLLFCTEKLDHYTPHHNRTVFIQKTYPSHFTNIFCSTRSSIGFDI